MQLKRYSARIQVQIGRDSDQQLQIPVLYGHEVTGKIFVRENADRVEHWDMRVRLMGRHGGAGAGLTVREDGSFLHAGLADQDYHLMLAPSVLRGTSRKRFSMTKMSFTGSLELIALPGSKSHSTQPAGKSAAK